MKSKWLLLLLWMCMVARPEAWGQEVKSANTVAEEWIQVNSSSATVFIIRKSKFPQNPKRSVRFLGKGTKRSVQKRKARNTQKAETKVL